MDDRRQPMKKNKIRKSAKPETVTSGKIAGRSGKLPNYLQHLLYPGVLLIVALIIYWSLTVEGKIYTQGDNINDAVFYQKVQQYHQETGEIARWNPYVFGGIPNIFNLPKSWVSVDFYLELLAGSLSIPFVFFWLGALGQFVLLRYLKFGQLEALFGSLVFLLAPYYHSLAINGHGTKIQAIAFVPWIVWSLLQILNGDRRLQVALLILLAGLQLRTSHYQIVFYTAILAFILVAGHFIRELKAARGFPWRTLAILSIAAAGSVVISGRPLLLAANYAGDSVRGREVIRLSDEQSLSDRQKGVSMAFVRNWSFAPRELLSLVLARAQGGTSNEQYAKAESIGLKEDIIPAYWGHSPFNGSYYYLGTFVFFLMLAGFFRWKDNPLRWEWTAGLILMLIWSLGTFAGPFYSFSYQFIPFFSNFRTPTTSMSIVYLLTSILAVYGLKSLRHLGKSEMKTVVRLAAGIGGIAGLFFIAGNIFSFINRNQNYPEGYLDLLVEARRAMYHTDLLWYLGTAAIFMTLVWLLAQKKIDWRSGAIIFTILSVVDLGVVWYRYSDQEINRRDFHRTFLADSQTSLFLKNDPSVYRVFIMSNQHFGLPAHVQSMGGGYDMQMNTTVYELMNNNLYRRIDGKTQINWNVLDFMNIKYVVSDRLIENDRLSLELEDPVKGTYLYRYKFNKERGFFVDEFEVIRDDVARLRMINSPAFDVRRMAILEEAPEEKVFPASRSRVDLLSFDPNKVVYTVETERPGLFVMADIYHPKIQEVYLDGAPAGKVYKTNHAIQSLVVPEGLHTIEFRYKKQWFAISQWISNIGFVILYLVLGYWLVSGNKQSALRKGKPVASRT
jgi:hypothetical protein